jgi:hypothetical protein
MKKIIFRLSVLSSLMMLLTACPYQSKVAISNPSEKVNKALFGDWVSTAEIEYENPTYYKIKKFNKTKYDVIEMSYSSYDSTYSEKQYYMHSSTIGDRTFMNVEDVTANEGFYLYYIEIGNDEFTLFELSDNIDEQFTSSTDLKKFIEKNMDLSFFYNKTESKYVNKKKIKK